MNLTRSFFGLGWLWMILFWGIVIGLIAWAISKFSKRESSGSKANYMEIVRERYARGEISKEEFEQIKKDLS